MFQIGQNWVSSDDPVGTPISSSYIRKGGIPLVSAGHRWRAREKKYFSKHCSFLSKHEWTTWAASGQLFEVIEQIKEGASWKKGSIKDSEELNTGGQPDLKEDLW